MNWRTLLVVLSSLVLFAVAEGHAVNVPAGEVYWIKVFPNTPIPTAIKQLLTPLAGSATGERIRITKPKLVYRNIYYKGAATETELQDNLDAPLFFLETDLQPGNKMTWQFTRTASSGATIFTTRREADSIPFTSAKFHDILTHFSIQPNSMEAEYLNLTLQGCEKPAMKGECKFCANSLQSMVEFSIVSIGTRKIQVVSTNVDGKGSSNINYLAKQQYTITSVLGVGFIQTLKFDEGPLFNLVVCHAQTYAYAVFLCHTIEKTKAYQVRMVGKDGTKVETVVACHIDTSEWNPENLAFRLLHVKPGSVPICYFLALDSLVWAPETN